MRRLGRKKRKFPLLGYEKTLQSVYSKATASHRRAGMLRRVPTVQRSTAERHVSWNEDDKLWELANREEMLYACTTKESGSKIPNFLRCQAFSSTYWNLGNQYPDVKSRFARMKVGHVRKHVYCGVHSDASYSSVNSVHHRFLTHKRGPCCANFTVVVTPSPECAKLDMTYMSVANSMQLALLQMTNAFVFSV